MTQSNKESHTNIYRLAHALRPSDKGIPQIVYYSNGVGARAWPWGLDLVAGATGAGYLVKVEEIYGFICMNWELGDEVSGDGGLPQLAIS